MTTGITALGHALPRRVVTNHDLEEALSTTDEWIQTRTGIKQRHVAADDEFTSHLAIASVQNLIDNFGAHTLDGVDLIIVATATPDAFFPSTAALVQAHFQLNAAAFDLSNACAGFVYALNVAAAQLAHGTARKALVIGAETFSKVVNWQDRSTAVLFGDGAGAVILESVPAPHGFQSFAWGTNGDGAANLHVGALACSLPNGEALERHIVQNGREVFKFATRAVPEAIALAVERAGLTLDDVDAVVPHQANSRIIDAAADRLGVPREKFVVTTGLHANTGAASVPLALQHAHAHGQLKPGDRVVLVGFGGGYSWASTLLTWTA